VCGHTAQIGEEKARQENWIPEKSHLSSFQKQKDLLHTETKKKRK
jgi:hypothetical protein